MSNIEYQIIDNVLSKKDFLNIKDYFFGQLRWKYCKKIVGDENVKSDYKLDNYMFAHQFYSNVPFHISKHISIILPILDQLNINELIRCKANFYSRTEKIIQHNYHIDNDKPHLVGLYYINTNNGFTLFNSGEKIESVENRLLIFDGKIKHASTTSSDNVRVNVNINFSSEFSSESQSKPKNINYG